MAESTKIEWCDHTFNPWLGCQAVSMACDHCYAEALDKRFGGVGRWGPHGERKRTSEANWQQPQRWDAANGGSSPMPADRAALLALAERCEKAPGEDCQLGAEIHRAIGWQTMLLRGGTYWLGPTGKTKWELPKVTGSIDAALTLNTNGWILITLSDIAGDGLPFAKFGSCEGLTASGCARTLPLALCAAALRALAETADE